MKQEIIKLNNYAIKGIYVTKFYREILQVLKYNLTKNVILKIKANYNTHKQNIESKINFRPPRIIGRRCSRFKTVERTFIA